MTNKNRGEVSIYLVDKEYTMRPTFHALCSIETEINRSIIDVLLQLSESKPKLKEIEVIIYHGTFAWNENELARKDIGQLICKTGVVNILPAVVEFLEISLGIR